MNMSNINYGSRFQKAVFCEEDITNSASRAMLFVGFEYRAGGEPVYRSTKKNVRKNLRSKRFLAELRRAALKRHINAQRRTGVRRPHLKTVLEMKARRAKSSIPSRANNDVRVVWGR
jgi:hypothetical protein